MEFTIDPLTLAYSVFNALRLASYGPQILAVARDQNRASAISISCWLIWIGANGTTALYAWIKLGDIPLALLNGFNTLCCACIVVLVIFKRLAPTTAEAIVDGARLTMPLLQTSIIEIVGFMAAASTVAAFSCSRMVALRVAAIIANLLFIAYGSALGLMPIWLLHAILLPLNIWRLLRCLQDLGWGPLRTKRARVSV